MFRDDGTQFGSPVAYVSKITQGPRTIGGLFTVEQLSHTPSVVSNISFTAVSSINRYTIVCEDANTLNNETVVINIPGKKYILCIILCTLLHFLSV